MPSGVFALHDQPGGALAAPPRGCRECRSPPPACRRPSTPAAHSPSPPGSRREQKSRRRNSSGAGRHAAAPPASRTRPASPSRSASASSAARSGPSPTISRQIPGSRRERLDGQVMPLALDQRAHRDQHRSRRAPAPPRAASRSSGRKSLVSTPLRSTVIFSARRAEADQRRAQPGADRDDGVGPRHRLRGSAAAAPGGREAGSRPIPARSAPRAGRTPPPAAPRRPRRGRGSGRRWRRTRAAPSRCAARGGWPGGAGREKNSCRGAEWRGSAGGGWRARAAPPAAGTRAMAPQRPNAAAPAGEPGHRRQHRAGRLAGRHQVAQPVLDEDAVVRLLPVGEQGGEGQQPQQQRHRYGCFGPPRSASSLRAAGLSSNSAGELTSLVSSSTALSFWPVSFSATARW